MSGATRLRAQLEVRTGLNVGKKSPFSRVAVDGQTGWPKHQRKKGGGLHTAAANSHQEELPFKKKTNLLQVALVWKLRANMPLFLLSFHAIALRDAATAVAAAEFGRAEDFVPSR